MKCPICNNLVSSGRCYHSLEERTRAANVSVRVHENHRLGRIDISEATYQINQITRINWK